MATKKVSVKMPVRGARTATNNAKLEEAKWRAQDDVHHLKRAAEVRADPARHKAAVAHAQSELKALQSVTKK